MSITSDILIEDLLQKSTGSNLLLKQKGNHVHPMWGTYLGDT